MKRILFVLLCILSVLSVSEGFERFEFKENVILPRLDSYHYSMMGSSKIDPVIGIELTNNIYLGSNGHLIINIYEFAGRKLGKNIKMIFGKEYLYIENNNLVYETSKKKENKQINLNSMKLDNMKIERKGTRLEESVFPILYETVETINSNTYKLSSYMKFAFFVKKIDDQTIEIYSGEKLENTLKLENGALNIYDKKGNLEVSFTESEDSIIITEKKKTVTIAVNPDKIEVFESNRKKGITYNITEM